MGLLFWRVSASAVAETDVLERCWRGLRSGALQLLVTILRFILKYLQINGFFHHLRFNSSRTLKAELWGGDLKQFSNIARRKRSFSHFSKLKS